MSRTLSTYLYVLELEGSNDDNNGTSNSGRDVVAKMAMFHDTL